MNRSKRFALLMSAPMSAQMSAQMSALIAVLVAVSVVVSSIGLAQAAPGQSSRLNPYKLPPNLLVYFQEKYVDVDDFLISTIIETPDGPLGQINVRGSLSPGIELEGETREERAREAARAMIENEAELLDILDLSEIREMKYHTMSDGVAVFQYQRFIGDLNLIGVSLRVDVGPDERIKRFYATLVPNPRGLYEAERREALDEEEIIKIVMEDLTPPAPGRQDPAAAESDSVPAEADPAAPNHQSQVRITRTAKLAQWQPPYVIWAVGASVGGKPAWGYTIDAFTGEIMKKSCHVVSVARWRGRLPCE